MEESDTDPKWKKLVSRSSHYITNPKTQLNHCEYDEFSFRMTAIREIFEEVNVLIAHNQHKHKKSDLHTWRAKVQKDDTKLWDMMQELQMEPAVEQLLPWAHWITPLQEQYRYNTLFYLAVLDSVSAAQEDQVETTAMQWVTPQQALLQFNQGSMILPPPTWLLLTELAEHTTIDKLVEVGKKRVFGVDLKPIMPKILMYNPEEKDEEVEALVPPGRQAFSLTVLPGDGKHPEHSHSNDRNRMVVTMDSKNPTFATFRYTWVQKTTAAKSKL